MELVLDDCLERYYEEMQEYEIYRKLNPTCQNCNNCYEECGYLECKKHGCLTWNGKPCEDWK